MKRNYEKTHDETDFCGKFFTPGIYNCRLYLKQFYDIPGYGSEHINQTAGKSAYEKINS